MINIAATFVCTILAYQNVALRQGGRNLQQQLEDKDLELQQNKRLLVSLTTSDFSQSMAERCNEEVQATSKTTGWGRSSPKDYSDSFTSIIHQALSRRIGDAGLSEKEKRDQIQIKLQEAQHELMVQQQEEARSSILHTEEPESIEVVEEPSGATVVRKRNFSI